MHMPDKVLNFVKDHFLMDSVIRSAPLLLKRSVRYTQIAVHKIQGMERAYDVLFIGTGSHPGSLFLCLLVFSCNYSNSLSFFFSSSDDGRLHKAINANDKMHIIEEMILFPGSQRVQHIELDSQRVRFFTPIEFLCTNIKEAHLPESQSGSRQFHAAAAAGPSCKLQLYLELTFIILNGISLRTKFHYRFIT